MTSQSPHTSEIDWVSRESTYYSAAEKYAVNAEIERMRHKIADMQVSNAELVQKIHKIKNPDTDWVAFYRESKESIAAEQIVENNIKTQLTEALECMEHIIAELNKECNEQSDMIEQLEKVDSTLPYIQYLFNQQD